MGIDNYNKSTEAIAADETIIKPKETVLDKAVKRGAAVSFDLQTADVSVVKKVKPIKKGKKKPFRISTGKGVQEVAGASVEIEGTDRPMFYYKDTDTKQFVIVDARIGSPFARAKTLAKAKKAAATKVSRQQKAGTWEKTIKKEEAAASKRYTKVTKKKPTILMKAVGLTLILFVFAKIVLKKLAVG